ncbi:hypothetical protein STEG23_032496 [Scotinomys teguina]
MVAAIAVLVKDAGKLTLGQPLTVLASHAVEALVRQPPDRWLSNARMTHYQALLLDSDRVTFGAPVSLNPATLLPLPDFSQEHDCLQILAEAHGTRPDLTDQPLNNPDLVWYTDGSSFLENGECRAGATVTTETEVIWASALPPGTSAQRAELIALTQALRLRGHWPGIHWETDFTEVKPGLYGYRYLLVFVDTFSGWIEAFPTKKETANMVVKKMLEEIFPSPTLEAHLQALQLVQKEVWKPLAQAYQEQLSRPVVPHPFQIGDSIWVRRHQAKNLEPRWKGPYTVLLTTPTALKVDGIAAWVHASHVKAAVRETESAEATSWTVRHTQNPLKIRLSHDLPSPSSLP